MSSYTCTNAKTAQTGPGLVSQSTKDYARPSLDAFVCPRVRVCVTSHSTFAKIDRSYLLLFSVSAVSGNFRSFWLFFALLQVGGSSVPFVLILSKRILLGIRLEPEFCPLFAVWANDEKNLRPTEFSHFVCQNCAIWINAVYYIYIYLRIKTVARVFRFNKESLSFILLCGLLKCYD